jgi:hypothetical protein
LTGDTGYAGLPSASNHNTLTFGGTGQGVETQHDVWRQMDYGTLDAIAVREADFTGGRLRVVANLAAAYPPAAGVTSFVRTLRWDGDTVVTVVDEVTLASARTAEWHLQSDSPFTGSANVYENARAGEPRLHVSFAPAAGLRAEALRGIVQAPGPPGSIEKGPREERGYVLRLLAPAAVTHRFEVKLEIGR